MAAAAMLGQRSFDDLGVPLAEATFCVLDLETTGGDRNNDMITEIGAVKVRGGECLATFQTLVNPGRAIPPRISVLTGLTDALVCPAPRIDAVLGSLVDFIGDAVFVGHNVGFDLAFLRAALERDGRSTIAPTVVDTAALARRLVRDEVPDCRLGTLASRFRLDHRPTHRALDDALATTDLLHLLLERAAGLGVLGLDDLVALAKLAGHPQSGEVEADRAPAPLPWRVPVLRSPRRGAVRRQGDQPPPAGPELLRQRRSPQDRADAARDPDGQASRRSPIRCRPRSSRAG